MTNYVLKDLIEISKDGEWGKSSPFEKSIEMMCIRGTDFEDIRGGNYENAPKRHIPKHIAEYKKLRPLDLIIETAGGSKGRITGRTVLLKPSLFERAELPVICASFSRFIRLRCELCDQEFVFWYLQHLYFSGNLNRYHTQHTGVSRFQWTIFSEREKINIPSLHVQRKIAGILSAYDDLIENNLRRIKILEEMARSLYREWFVSFRFPGHEKVQMIDSPLGKIPKGWEVTSLGQQLSVLETGKRPKGGIQDIDEGIPSIGAENINGIANHDFNKEKLISRDFFEQMRKGIVRDRDVAIYKDGAYIGRSSYFRDGYPHTECCVNEHVFLLRTAGKQITQNMLFLWLQEPDTIYTIRSTNANAAQPGINQQGISGIKLILPDEKIAEQFDRIVEPMLGGIIALAKKSHNLHRTRDLLLPKLISGELDVSELDIAVPEKESA